MRLRPVFLLFPALLASANPSPAQETALAGPSQTGAPPTASSLLAPALGGLKGSLAAVRVDKWKAPKDVREETTGNIGSIQRDLDGTLPGLLAAADAAPGSPAKNLPVFRNVDALYDVLLRISQVADLFGPQADMDALHGALSSLENGRRSLGDAIQTSAVAEEQQVSALRTQAEAQRTAAPSKTTSATVVDDGGSPKPVHKHKAVKAHSNPAQNPQ